MWPKSITGKKMSTKKRETATGDSPNKVKIFLSHYKESDVWEDREIRNYKLLGECWNMSGDLKTGQHGTPIQSLHRGILEALHLWRRLRTALL